MLGTFFYIFSVRPHLFGYRLKVGMNLFKLGNSLERLLRCYRLSSVVILAKDGLVFDFAVCALLKCHYVGVQPMEQILVEAVRYLLARHTHHNDITQGLVSLKSRRDSDFKFFSSMPFINCSLVTVIGFPLASV